MSNILRWGILGASNFAERFMAPAIHAAIGNELVALATSNAAKAAPFQAFCPSLEVFGDYDALLASPNIDAVYIPLPNHLHVAWTKKALQAGKHVLCEKPVALEANEIDDLIALRDQTGLVAAEAFMIAHHPQWIEVRDRIAAGDIGTLRHVSGQFCYNNESATDNIRNLAEFGGGAARDIGVYIYASTLFATGAKLPEITAVSMREEGGVDVFTDVQAQFEGFTYSGMVSMRLAPHQEMLFLGDKGKIRVTTPFNANVAGEAQVWLSNEAGETVSRYPGLNQYVLQVENFAQFVGTGAAYPYTLEDSKKAQSMMDQIFAKAKK
ncbi:Gfo/Idh/MocA family protein [Falsihalocynthiibacter arcticus]|uniref:Oxidoreductase n=1 Tax=Falsihalocynthiibacter arcticus TaxID=1579316 RepID=A0A126V031_9RHOB|nr:Gfo/Idh/MocA family oxidoreductase [Falsihalocynthiibacter arcticus]AML51663.1 oxidoreductase [Falsihalocynthiibacter arcticus]